VDAKGKATVHIVPPRILPCPMGGAASQALLRCVTTLVDTDGDALERYVYSPYGVLTIYNASWSSIRSDSSYDAENTYTGRRFDPETELYCYRHRIYAAELRRFPGKSRDRESE
jgi:RHS repeat-associated protein